MKRALLSLAAALLVPTLASAQPASEVVKGEDSQLFLKQVIVLDTDLDTAWAMYTSSEGASRWMAPQVEVDLKPGGTIRSQYDPNASIDDPGTVSVTIVNYAPRTLLTLQADLSQVGEAEWLTPEVRAAADQLYNVILFEAVDTRRTRITSWGIGYRDAPGWEKMIGFFTVANGWTLGELRKAVAALPAPEEPQH
ncbi:SRPBCC domain-containing protein [Sphingomicrobium flavum]|uniref:SRPBCC domain-containing protein n=1 Tax=Sphingomicrobium flavum TaxID=1229164 RepID=UPI0021AE18B3|nr:SRPBCC domain-containing protein [Sphingomicrobium flavum]